MSEARPVTERHVARVSKVGSRWWGQQEAWCDQVVLHYTRKYDGNTPNNRSILNSLLYQSMFNKTLGLTRSSGLTSERAVIIVSIQRSVQVSNVAWLIFQWTPRFRLVCRNINFSITINIRIYLEYVWPDCLSFDGEGSLCNFHIQQLKLSSRDSNYIRIWLLMWLIGWWIQW